MADSPTELLREHVERWRRANEKLKAVKARELCDTGQHLAIAQIFTGHRLIQDVPRLTTSELVEQQRWFMKVGER